VVFCGILNCFVSCLLDKDETPLVGYLEKGTTIMAKYCTVLLDKLKQQLISKHQVKFLKGIILLQENALPHIVAITHQIWPLRINLSLNLKIPSRGGHFRALRRPH
jgi:hypothetical protein